jgi:hypothetical protein
LRAASGDVAVDQFSVRGSVFSLVLGVLLFTFQGAAFANKVLCVQSCGAILLSQNLRALGRDSGEIRGFESCDGDTEESLIVTFALLASKWADLAVRVHILLVRLKGTHKREIFSAVAFVFLLKNGLCLRAAIRNPNKETSRVAETKDTL